MQPTQLFAHWQALLDPFADAFTYPGFNNFTRWLTGLVLNTEERTITQSLIGLERPNDWKALEAFAEYGRWDQDTVERVSAQLIDQAPDRCWYGYRVWAGDDSKVHRSSKNVWGTCTFHEYTARCPNRASTVRAHNWLVLGTLLPRPSQPACFLPHTGRLYFRRSQLPAGEVFQTKNTLLVDLLQREAQHVTGKHLAVFDGAYAVAAVVRPLLHPAPGQPRVDILTRLRQDARVYRLPEAPRPHRRGPKRKWAAACRHRARAVAGQGHGRPARPGSTGAGGGSTGRKSCASGGSPARTWWSRSSWPTSRATASASPWSAAPRN